MNQTPNARHWMRGDLKAYVDGELTGWRQQLTARHIARCASCRDEVAWLRQMNGHFAEWENGDGFVPRPELRARILACLPADPPLLLTPTSGDTKVKMAQRRARRYVFQPTFAFGSLAAIVLLIGGAFALNLRPSIVTPLPVAAAPVYSSINTPNSVAAARPDKSLHVVSIFRAPKNSFKAAEPRATSVATSARNSFSPAGAAETHSTPEGTSNAVGSSAFPPPSEETYSDPTSREAERLAALKIGEMLSAKHHLAASAKPAPHLPPPSHPTNPAAPTTDSQIALAVANVSEAQQQLQQWAGTAGAKLRVMTEKDNPPALLNSNGALLPLGTLLEVRVPAQFAGSLQAHLSRIGTPLTLSGRGVNKPHPLTSTDSSNAVEQARVSPLPSIPVPAPGHPNVLITFRVRLLPGEAVPQP